MEMATDMKNLGEDIVASYDMRVKAIGTLVKDTHKMLKGFRSEHKEMAGILRAGLEKGETARLKDFKSMMADIQKAIKEIEAYTANKLKEFHTTHEEMADNLKESLEKGETDRLKNFKVMMGDIKKCVAGIVSETKKLLGEYRSDMKKTANVWQGMCKTMARARKGLVVVPKVETEVKVRPVEEAIAEANPRKKARGKRGK